MNLTTSQGPPPEWAPQGPPLGSAEQYQPQAGRETTNQASHSRSSLKHSTGHEIPLPRQMVYDGKNQWESFQRPFESMAANWMLQLVYYYILWPPEATPHTHTHTAGSILPPTHRALQPMLERDARHTSSV